MSAHFIIECIDCGQQAPYHPSNLACPNCGGTWREARYDYTNIAHTLPLQLPGRP